MYYRDWNYKDAKFEELVGKTLEAVEQVGDTIYFIATDDTQYRMEHIQDCCEGVYIESIVGDLNDLVGSPILVAEESISDVESLEYGDIAMWTFYKLATAKGYVDIRWHGSSNGYYSVGVDFVRKEND